MKEHVDLIWLATFVAIVFVALLVVAGLTFVLPFYLAIIIGVFTGLLFATKVVYDGYYPVPAKSKVVLLAFEDFYKVLGPGAHIVFPYFDIFDLEKDKDGEVKYFPIAIYPLPIFEREVVVEAAKNNESSVLTEFKDTQAYLIAKLYFYTVDVKQAYLGREDYVDDLKAWFRSLLRDYCRTRDLDEVDNEKENLGLKQIFLDKMENWDECNLKEEAENSDVEYSYIIKESGSIIIYLRDYGVWLRSFLLEDTILPHDIEEIQKKKNIAQVNQQVARIDAETAEISAGGVKKAWIEESDGIEASLQKLLALGIDEEQATRIINERQHWEGSKELEDKRGAWVTKSGGKTTIIIGDRNAQLGASAKAGGASIANS